MIIVDAMQLSVFPHTFPARRPAWLSECYRYYWPASLAFWTILWLFLDSSRSALHAILASVAMTAITAFLLAFALPRAYEIDVDCLRLHFGWPHSHTFPFSDRLTFRKGSLRGLSSLRAAASSGLGTITITREHAAWWQWQYATICVEAPDDFIAAVSSAIERYYRRPLEPI
jgi:hypothetical protein